jgi:hypothetical protein
MVCGSGRAARSENRTNPTNVVESRKNQGAFGLASGFDDVPDREEHCGARDWLAGTAMPGAG